MRDLRCQCGKKIAEYTDTEVRIMDKKCKTVTALKVIDGKLTYVGIDHAISSGDKTINNELIRYGKVFSDELNNFGKQRIVDNSNDLVHGTTTIYRKPRR